MRLISSVNMPKLIPVLFSALCVGGASSLLYFAALSASESVPAFSTLNTKADGAKLLFDGLNTSGLVNVTRQFKNVSVQRPSNSVVFFLGVEPFKLAFAEQPYFETMENVANTGNRVVIAIQDFGAYENADLARWGIRFQSSSLKPDARWRPAYGEAVWQRHFGKGSIILVSQATRLSNKGIATDEANRKLLGSLLSGYRSVVFEEAHLGIVETGSIAGLARHYHLQGLLAGLLVLAGLFIWSRSVNFSPTPSASSRSVAGADTRSMLTEMMSRHLKGQLIGTCVAEWNRTRQHSPALEIPAETGAVAAYTKLQESLQEKTKYRI